MTFSSIIYALQRISEWCVKQPERQIRWFGSAAFMWVVFAVAILALVVLIIPAMTLFIAFLLLYQSGFSLVWYVAACILCLLHSAAHSKS